MILLAHAAQPALEPAHGNGPSPEESARRVLPAFLVLGLLFGFLGAVLPAWGYHLSEDFITAGDYFFSLGVGILLSVVTARPLLAWKGLRFALIGACSLACGSLLFLALFCPPAAVWGRFLGLGFLGLSAGLLNSALFHGIWPLYRRDPAASVNLAGALFGLGCLMAALLVAGTYYAYTVPSILILTALVPGFFALSFTRGRLSSEAVPEAPRIADLLREFKSPGAILLAFLLLAQSANEWAIAGWLAVFLIRRLGLSPETSLLMLGIFWSALLVGRLAAKPLLPHWSHGRLLLGAAFLALFGCLVLSLTNNTSGVVAGVLFVGAGFAPLYPLTIEKIGGRFPSYHPGFYNRIFSFSMTAGFLAPCLIGYLAQVWGIRIMMAIPAIGSCLVFFILLLLALEARLKGWLAIEKV